MIPLLPFAAGLVAGGLAVRLWRSEEARAGVKAALDSLGETARSGLDLIRPAAQEAATGKAKPIAQKKAPARKKKTAPGAARKHSGKGKPAQS